MDLTRRNFVKIMGASLAVTAMDMISDKKTVSADAREILDSAGKNRPEMAKQAYLNNATCAQAIISSYAEDMGLDKEMAVRMMETFGGGIAGRQEACGAFVAANIVLSYIGSNGKFEYSETRNKNFARTRELADLFEAKYGGLKCIDVLKGNKPKAGHCYDTVSQTANMLEKVIAVHKEELKGQANL